MKYLYDNFSGGFATKIIFSLLITINIIISYVWWFSIFDSMNLSQGREITAQSYFSVLHNKFGGSRKPIKHEIMVVENVEIKIFVNYHI